jgi:hypothetical protein
VTQRIEAHETIKIIATSEDRAILQKGNSVASIRLGHDENVARPRINRAKHAPKS